MLQKIFFFLILISSHLHSEWRNDWAIAVEQCQNKKFDDAVINFTNCISEIEARNDNSGLHVYIDRARLYLIQNKFKEALDDLDKVIENKNLSKKDLNRALVSRICAKSNLEISEGINEDLKLLWETLPEKQELEFTKKHIIIRNVPECDCFKSIVSNFVIKAGYCNSDSNIRILDSGTMIIDRTDKCDCGCKNNENNVILNYANEKPSSCIEWCDYFTIGAATWCGKAFKSYGCQVACLSAVEMIRRRICYPCCREDNFYRTCIQPFSDIAPYIQAPCDPMWD